MGPESVIRSTFDLLCMVQVSPEFRCNAGASLFGKNEKSSLLTSRRKSCTGVLRSILKR